MKDMEQARASTEAARAADGAAMDALELIRQQRDGDLAFDFSKTLTEVVAAVRETGRAGKVKLTLTVAPSARGDASKVLVRDDIEAVPPRPERSPSLYYTTEANGLSRENPRQQSFRDVAPEAGFPEAER